MRISRRTDGQNIGTAPTRGAAKTKACNFGREEQDSEAVMENSELGDSFCGKEGCRRTATQ